MNISDVKFGWNLSFFKHSLIIYFSKLNLLLFSLSCLFFVGCFCCCCCCRWFEQPIISFYWISIKFIIFSTFAIGVIVIVLTLNPFQNRIYSLDFHNLLKIHVIVSKRVFRDIFVPLTYFMQLYSKWIDQCLFWFVC